MTLFTLFLTFFKIGLFTVGGGYAMIPVMQREIVDVWHCIANDTFVNFIGIAESTPGPIAINMATFVGFELFGIIGSIVAILAVVLPSFIIILIIAKLFAKFSKSKVIKRMFWGFKPVVAGLILAAAVTLGLSAIIPTVSLKTFTFDFSGFESLQELNIYTHKPETDAGFGVKTQTIVLPVNSDSINAFDIEI